MIILITQGGGVQNWAKVDYVICARSLNPICHLAFYYLETICYNLTFIITGLYNVWLKFCLKRPVGNRVKQNSSCHHSKIDKNTDKKIVHVYQGIPIHV